MKLSVLRLWGEAPLQGVGYLDGRPWYFRARGNQWEFAISCRVEVGWDAAIAATAHHGDGLLLRKVYRDTTRLTEQKARAIIRRAARAAAAFLE